MAPPISLVLVLQFIMIHVTALLVEVHQMPVPTIPPVLPPPPILGTKELQEVLASQVAPEVPVPPPAPPAQPPMPKDVPPPSNQPMPPIPPNLPPPPNQQMQPVPPPEPPAPKDLPPPPNQQMSPVPPPPTPVPLPSDQHLPQVAAPPLVPKISPPPEVAALPPVPEVPTSPPEKNPEAPAFAPDKNQLNIKTLKASQEQKKRITHTSAVTHKSAATHRSAATHKSPASHKAPATHKSPTSHKSSATHKFRATHKTRFTEEPETTEDDNTSSTIGCTDQEKDYLIPLYDLDGRINGRATRKNPLLPNDKPSECDKLPFFNPQRAAVECFRAWGLSVPVAKCFATEEVARRRQGACAGPCMGWNGVFHGLHLQFCQNCLSSLQRKTQTCTWEAMRLSDDCQACQAQAHDYQDQHCKVICAGSFDRGVDEASNRCLTCNDKFYDMLSQCNAYE